MDVLVIAEPLVQEADLEEEDRCIPGVYQIDIQESDNLSQAASIALDGFHSQIVVGCLDNFSFSVMTLDEVVLQEEDDYEPYSGFDKAGDVVKVKEWEWSV